ncbi:CHASE3 domain-containing protein [Magnetococcales bacterium HHB-1]
MEKRTARRMNIHKIIFLGFGLILSIMTLLAVAQYLNLQKTEENVDWVVHTYEVKLQTQRFLTTMIDGETGQRGFLFTGKENFLMPYEAARERYQRELDALIEKVDDNPTQVERLQKVKQLARSKFDELKETIQLKKTDQSQALMDLVSSGVGKHYMDEIRTLLTTLVQEEDRLLAIRSKEMKKSNQFLLWTSLGGTIIAILIGLIVARTISGKIMRPIEETVEKIVGIMSSVTTTVAEQERVAAQQATSMTETNSAMGELGASSRMAAEQAGKTARGAERATELSLEGLQLAEENLKGLHQAGAQVEKIGQEVTLLSEKTNKIRNISAMVADFANETKMLAMNAAVEAVRAGEQGQGFSVLAVETRKLADESKRSAGEINDLAHEVHSATISASTTATEGKQSMESVLSVIQNTEITFQKMAEAVRDASTGSQEISLSAQQQSAAIGQIMTAMTSLQNGAQENQAGIAQTKESMTTLSEAAHKLGSLT